MNFKRTPTFSLPGAVEAEDYFVGEGMAIVPTADGYALGNTATGSWAEYSINITEAGKYNYEATVSSVVEGSKFSMVMVESDGTEKTLGTVTVPQTGSLDTYEVKTGKIRNPLKAGQQKLRITVTGGSCNIDKVNLVSTETGIMAVTRDDDTTGDSYNLAGQKVDANYKGIVIRNGKKIIRK